MNRTILVAIGGPVLGLALSTVGTLLLGAARAVARHPGSAEHRTRADLKQYAAALCALIGFLLTAGGGGLLARELLGLHGPSRTIAAVGVGVALFAAAGVIFSRIADLAEDAKASKIPRPAYEPRPAAPPVPTSGGPVQTAPKPDEDGPTPGQALGGRHAVPEPLDELSASGTSIPDGETLLRAVRPGWIYRDQADRWYLGVVDAHTGALPLLRLPDFALVPVAEPVYPVTVAGAGEIAVVPLPTAAELAAEADPSDP